MTYAQLAQRISMVLLCALLASCAAIQEKLTGSPSKSATITTADAESVQLSPSELHQRHMAQVGSIQSFQLKGRLGVQAEGKGYSASTQWSHQNTSDNQIKILSPIGTELANLTTNAEEVSLQTQDGKRYLAKDAESLTQDTLGWRLPLQGLEDWALGRPSKKIAELIEWDGQGKITKMIQNGWQIEYPEYTQKGDFSVPKKIFLKHPKLSLKIAVEEWLSINEPEK